MTRQSWADALALASRLGLPPNAFWALSLIEWRAITQPSGSHPLKRSELNDLLANYLDKSDD